MRRIVAALAVLLFATFGLGVVTALNRAGDHGKPAASGTPTASPSPSPSPTSPAESPAGSPSAEPSPSPSAATTGGVPGVPEGPHMPSTGGSAALPLVALSVAGVAGGLRLARR